MNTVLICSTTQAKLVYRHKNQSSGFLQLGLIGRKHERTRLMSILYLLWSIGYKVYAFVKTHQVEQILGIFAFHWT